EWQPSANPVLRLGVPGNSACGSPAQSPAVRAVRRGTRASARWRTPHVMQWFPRSRLSMRNGARRRPNGPVLFPPGVKETSMVSLSRRALLGYTAAGVAAGAVGSAFGARSAAAAPRGTLLDYAAGVPSAEAIKAAGHAGVIRYVSDRRPGAEWMAGKPLLAGEVSALREAGLAIVSCYQFGKGPTADWRGGLEAGKRH